jgi:hypothetical protein
MDLSYIPDTSDSYDYMPDGEEPTMEEIMPGITEIEEYIYCAKRRAEWLLNQIKVYEKTPNSVKRVVVQKDIADLNRVLEILKEVQRLI